MENGRGKPDGYRVILDLAVFRQTGRRKDAGSAQAESRKGLMGWEGRCRNVKQHFLRSRRKTVCGKNPFFGIIPVAVVIKIHPGVQFARHGGGHGSGGLPPGYQGRDELYAVLVIQFFRVVAQGIGMRLAIHLAVNCGAKIQAADSMPRPVMG
ncbi:MAG: hypothetical protein BWY09_00766 [Candidatus Hydrogenedentes bacterium ADurb.Bin179]|nr:MAG: hypothetical protein BWY09_00766 [Candidatus Hydrogenedentes bacterium ADurb.Bin179]